MLTQGLVTRQKPAPIMAPRKPPPTSSALGGKFPLPPSSARSNLPKDRNSSRTGSTPISQENDVVDDTTAGPAIHKKFRLFLVTTADSANLLPGMRRMIL